MTSLFENSLPIAVVGGLLATFALVVFLRRARSGGDRGTRRVSASTLLLLLVERFVVTAREHIENVA